MKAKKLIVLALLVTMLVSTIACGEGGEPAPTPTPALTPTPIPTPTPTPTPTGAPTNVYSKYGFSFEYPAGVAISEEGLFSSTADENSGMVSWEPEDEFFALGWFKTIIWDSRMTEDAIDGGIEGGREEAEALWLIGGKVTRSISGFDVMYQLFGWRADGDEGNGIIGVWYCEPGTTAFWAVFLVTEAALPYVLDFLPTFECQ